MRSRTRLRSELGNCGGVSINKFRFRYHVMLYLPLFDASKTRSVAASFSKLLPHVSLIRKGPANVTT